MTTPLKLLAPGHGFASAHILGGLLGLLLTAWFWLEAGEPDPAEAVALAWLASPLAVGIYALLRPQSLWPQILSVMSLPGLVAYAAAFTGGLASPFLFWFTLAPMEAALTGRRALVLLSSLEAGLGVAALALLQQLGWLPQARLSADAAAFLHIIAPLAAILYAAAVAIASENAHAQAHARAIEGEAKYRILADNAVDMITRHAPDGRMAFVSPAVRGLLGYEPAEMRGRAPIEFVHADDQASVQNALALASYRGEAAGAEARLRRKDGTYVWAEIRCRPAGEGAPLRDIIAVTRDVTERKRQELELLAARDAAEGANRAKSRFLANMSHELRTPLNAIIGFSDMMRQEMFGKLGHAKYAEYARLVHQSGEQLLELIGDILDMSKIEAGKYELTRETLDVEHLIEQSLATMRAAAQKSGVRLKSEAKGEWTVLADKRALRQILLNLLSNAIKFTPAQGEVSVKVAREGSMLALTIADTGLGIPQEALARLGQPFEQVDSEYTRAQGGTGLGLAIVKALAHLHGGDVRIESTLGEGTRVTVRLPAPLPSIDAEPKGRPLAVAPIRLRRRA
ncbi:MAG: PAS domain S-box protein [Alphaproteobacteria bacterium]|nr:PAS domain S-box protein [Alphaproteobacteria bacterium]